VDFNSFKQSRHSINFVNMNDHLKNQPSLKDYLAKSFANSKRQGTAEGQSYSKPIKPPSLTPRGDF